MGVFADRVRFSTATTGTGAITPGAAASGYRALAGVIPDGTTVRYFIEDGSAWETGLGVVGSTGTTLSRSLSESSTGALLALSGSAVVFISPASFDLASVLTPESFGAVGDGVADDTTAIQNWLAAVHLGVGLLRAGKKYAVATDSVLIDATHAPRRITCEGLVTFVRKSGTGAVLTVTNPQNATNYAGLEIIGPIAIDGNNAAANGLLIHGLQDTGGFKARIQGIFAKNCTALGISIKGEPSYGVYGNTFSDFVAQNNASFGIGLQSINNTGNYYIAANVYENFAASGNTQGGFYIDYASGVFVNPWGESNTTASAKGVTLVHTQNIVFLYGHMEANGNATPGGAGDCSFSGTSGSSSGVRIHGTRTTGTVTGLVGGTDNIIQPSAIGYQVSGQSDAAAFDRLTANFLQLDHSADAPAGKVGEFAANSVLSSSPVAATTGTVVNVTSISLTAGDWDIVGHIYALPAGTTNTTAVVGSISLTSATLDTTPGRFTNFQTPGGIVTGGGAIHGGSQKTRLLLSATTTVYLVGLVNFTVSTNNLYGSIQARRVR